MADALRLALAAAVLAAPAAAEYRALPTEPGADCPAVIEINNACRANTGGAEYDVTVETPLGPVRARWTVNHNCADGPGSHVAADVFEVIEAPDGVTATPPAVETWEDGKPDYIWLCTGGVGM